jgi:competence protein ComEC
LLAGGGYMVLTGMHVPIVRSFAMACLYTFAVLAGRRAISLRGLALAAMVLMLLEPEEVPGVSFQMSFSAVLALIAGYEALRPALRALYGDGAWQRRFASHLVALALTSALAGTASLPYAAYHFGHVQIYYILSNMVAVPLAAFWVMPAGLVSLLLMPFGLEGLALVPMGWGAGLIIGVARFTASLPAASITVPHIPAWGLAVLSLGIAWLGIWRSAIRLIGVVAISIGIVSPAFDRPPDILVSADAGLIGFRTEQGVILRQARGENFVRDAWLTRWDLAEVAPPADGSFVCRTDACLFRPHEGSMRALLPLGPSRRTGCDGIAVVVSVEPARGVCPWPAPPLVDRFTVWKDGPAAIWLTADGARVLTDRQARGDRPWVPPPPKPKPRPVPDLPVAAMDDGS